MTVMTLGVIISGSLNVIYRFGSLVYLRGKLLEKIFLWAHLLSSKMARLLSSSPIMMFYVSPLQLLAKTSGVGVETFLKAVVISQGVLIQSGHGLN